MFQLRKIHNKPYYEISHRLPHPQYTPYDLNTGKRKGAY